MTGILESDKIAQLLLLVEEATRSSEQGVKHFVEPASGTLQRAVSRRHHIVFGRRGSGKSSLLRKAAADLTINRRPIAHVNLEVFKGHSYPDVLLSVLLATFKEFERWLCTAAVHPATHTSFWKRWLGITPTRSSYDRKTVQHLSERVRLQIQHLTTELHRTDGAELKLTSAVEAEWQTSDDRELDVTSPGKLIKAKIQGASSSSHSKKQGFQEQCRRSKEDFLHRHIIDYQELFKALAELSDGEVFLFLDDLYHIRRTDQARVLDYFHRIAKDHSLWLKVGTIRHRTNWYVRGDPPLGMKLGDDADEIDLDLTLEKYSLAKHFLVKILTNFATAAGIKSISSFITPGALDRLVLASGGVARDFLSIFRRSVEAALARCGGHRGGNVGAEDVNLAAGEYDSVKRQEFKLDTLDEDNLSLESEFEELRDFCLDQHNTNCFLLSKDLKGQEVDLIHELVDLKFLHLVRSSVRMSGRPGRAYEAYMLDLSQYAGSRKRRKLKMIEFWRPQSASLFGKVSLIYEPPLPSEDRIQQCIDSVTTKIRRTGKTPSNHLEIAKKVIKKLCAKLRVSHVRITGRVKSQARCREKMAAMPSGTMGAPTGKCPAMDMIGLRVVVKSDNDLTRLLHDLKRGATAIKDYVNNPRRDGEILGRDADDVYRAYHLFTDRITGVPMELQLFTIDMRQAGIQLKRKYGKDYWKSDAFRRKRVELGDLR